MSRAGGGGVDGLQISYGWCPRRPLASR